jgi:hypothetical protein
MTYGCYNRTPHAARYYCTGQTEPYGTLKSLANRGTRDCQYTKTALGAADAGCVGCSWRRGQLELKLWEDKDPNFR